MIFCKGAFEYRTRWSTCLRHGSCSLLFPASCLYTILSMIAQIESLSAYILLVNCKSRMFAWLLKLLYVSVLLLGKHPATRTQDVLTG